MARTKKSTRRCAYRKCRKVFKPNSAKHRYHSSRCKWQAWNEANPRRRASELEKTARELGVPLGE